MHNVELRNQRISDAKKFFEILSNPNFKYFDACPKDIEAEKDFLRLNAEKRKKNIGYNFAILLDGKLIGGCGIIINQHRKHIGEIGYFIDEKYWGKGFTIKAIKLLENFAFKRLGLKRIEILMMPENIPSEKVAINCGYVKEGTMRKSIHHNKQLVETHIYAKVV